MAHRALAHKSTDDVAVAVSELRPGETLTIEALDGGEPHQVKVLEAIPLGHKIALRDLPEGHVVIEYGEKIGRMTRAVKKGGYVHTHNIRTLRWDYGETSTAKRKAKVTASRKSGVGKGGK
ncbi:UxaA family hydrolase [Calidithermus roseus]|uniref:(2R)-sulfolactate sulfo-lyase subunit alpha n=1 Tax=Calidithermus roseus TaxID=1644118 RepID=A0A399F0W8_9DEIN|nr:UxaA family hydrolase [Calidithermus roseus]RIH89286.1 (2R)-sulfolactate sulfo-lyase subunit alpha [Calidithermus roseus]